MRTVPIHSYTVCDHGPGDEYKEYNEVKFQNPVMVGDVISWDVGDVEYKVTQVVHRVNGFSELHVRDVIYNTIEPGSWQER